jgi:S-adenosylmethionine:tRNA ribosyltransferase-isomerase
MILFDDQPPVVLEKDIGGGSWLVSFSSKTARERTVSHFGHVPLPHYIRREDQPGDIRRYQTVFADPDRVGAVAAPTAGFHFTRPLLDHLRGTGIFIAQLTLHVGPGTFKPIQTDRIEDHVVDPEYAELTAGTAGALNATRKRGGKIVAVGTTSVRTLESAPIKNGKVQPFSGMVDLYIRPGHRFKMVDHLVTNFHLPKSSLLVLVSAFAGREKILAAYREAINRHYRFYSYGDAMLIL